MKGTIARTSVAMVAAAAVAVSLLYPAQIAAAAGFPSDGVDVSPVTPVSVPAFEPQVGRGSPLLANIEQQISLGPGSNDAHSALIRVSVFTAVDDLTVSLAGSPALFVGQGRSASTSLLVPVVDGAVELISSFDANAKVEVLALFDAAAESAGATVAIAAPVTRADSESDLGDTIVGVLGVGGVPSEHVRAVHLTVSTTASAASTLVIDGQNIAVPVGTTVLSTIVTPSTSGDIDVSIPVAANVRIDVRGYVTEAAQQEDSLNGGGAYWPLPADDWQSFDSSPDNPAELDFDLPSTGGLVLALISATPAASLTMLETAAPYSGRARGAVVDVTAGAAPQLALMPAEQAQLLVRRGELAVELLVLGTLLGDGGSSVGPTITIDSPTSTELDVTEHITFDFDGSIETPGSVPLRIEATLNGEPYGAAEIMPSESGVTWHFTAAVPESGSYVIEFRVVDRDGGSSTASWSGTVIMPDEDDTVTAARAFAIGSAGHTAEIIEVTDDWIIFGGDPGVEPGNVIGSGVTPNAPAGFLRKVIAIDVVDGTWRVRTEFAALVDAYLQLDVDYIANPAMPDPSTIIVHPREHDPEVELVSSSFEIRPIDQMDVGPFLGPSTTPDWPSGIDFEDPPAVHGDDIFGLPAQGAARSMSREVISNTFEPTWGIDLAGSFSAGADLDLFPGDAGAGLSGDFDFSVTASIVIGQRVAIKIRTEISIIPLHIEVELVRLLTTAFDQKKTSFVTSLSASLHWDKPMEAPELTIPTPPIVIPTPLPIVFVTEIKLGIVGLITVGGSVTLEAGTATQSKWESGTILENGVPRKVGRGPSTTGKPLTIDGDTLSGFFEASAGPAFSISFKLWKVAGPQLEISALFGIGVSGEVDDGLQSPSVSLYSFVDISGSIHFVLGFPLLNENLLDVTLLEASFRGMIGEWSLTWNTAFPSGEYGTDGPEGTDPPDPDPEDETYPEPPPVLCEPHTAGSVRYVCTGPEFTAAVADPAITTVALLQNIDTWKPNGSPQYACDDPDAPQGLTLTVARNVTVDSQGHGLCLHGVDLAQGVTLTLSDNSWNSDSGWIESHASPFTNDAGFSTTGATLTVKSGNVYGYGEGGGAGIGGDRYSAAGTLRVLGGYAIGTGGGYESYNASGGDGGAGIGGGLLASGGIVIVEGGSVDGDGGDGAAGVGGGAYGWGGSISVSGGDLGGFSDSNNSDGSLGGGAGIGGGIGGNGAYLLVTGGTVLGISHSGGAGIGGGRGAYGTSTVIKGGEVEGYADPDLHSAGAGIGGGYGGSGGLISISGGEVTGDSEGDFSPIGSAGLGGGGSADGGTITISGGDIYASGAAGAAGIGGGDGGDSGTIRISGGTIQSFGHFGGAAIGSGRDADSSSIEITGADIYADSWAGDTGGAGIGSGAGGSTGEIVIRNSTIDAFGGAGGAGIGGGASSSSGSITIQLSTIYASGDPGPNGGGAAIGGGALGDSGSIVVENSTVEAWAADEGAGIGGGSGGDAGDISFVDSSIQAFGRAGGASVGGGSGGNSSSIVITSTTFYAYTDGDIDVPNAGAVLGGGFGGDGGETTITGSTLELYGSVGAAMIGGGTGGNGGAVSISADSLVTIGANGGNAIGHGEGGTLFGSLEVLGTLQLLDTTITLLPDAVVTVSGTIRGLSMDDPDNPTAEYGAFIDGEGTIQNDGLITAIVADSVTVTGIVYTVTFDANNVLSVDPTQTVRVFASTFDEGRREPVVPTPIAGYTFVEWNRNPDGTGAPLSTTDILTGDVTVYAIWEVV